jgi:sulfite exporter TauE/SafE
MTPELTALIYTAAGIGFLHTIIGPDHYLPFVALARAREWSTSRTMFVTGVCGLGHILSSVVLGMIGIATGAGLTKLVGIESVSGDLAAWALTAFGLVYLVWGLRRAFRGKGHIHLFGKHHLIGESDEKPANGSSVTTFWALFVVFVFGPCEALIPLLMYPAASYSFSGMAIVTAVFGVVTLLTMMGTVLVLTWGIRRVPLKGMERYAHALAGFALTACGLAIQLGL